MISVSPPPGNVALASKHATQLPFAHSHAGLLRHRIQWSAWCPAKSIVDLVWGMRTEYCINDMEHGVAMHDRVWAWDDWRTMPELCTALIVRFHWRSVLSISVMWSIRISALRYPSGFIKIPQSSLREQGRLAFSYVSHAVRRLRHNQYCNQWPSTILCQRPWHTVLMHDTSEETTIGSTYPHEVLQHYRADRASTRAMERDSTNLSCRWGKFKTNDFR